MEQPAKKQGKGQQTLLLVILFGTMLLNGTLNGVRGLSLPLIKDEFGVGYDTQGLMLLLTTAVGAVSTLAASVVFQKMGIKPSFLLSYAASVTAVLLLWLAPAFGVVILAYVLTSASLSMYEVGKNGLAAQVFHSRIALKMTILHMLFGIGNIIGPLFGEYTIGHLGLGWRQTNLLLLIPAGLLVGCALCAKFQLPSRPGQAVGGQAPPVQRITLRQAFRLPVVWLLAFVTSLAGAVEGGFANWSLLYLQDLYGLDPVTVGANFLAIFYVAFSLSRLVSGFALEKLGYERCLVGGTICVIALFATSFALGERGIWLLPATGVFIALYVPTNISIMIRAFRENATVLISASAILSALLAAAYQWLIGQTSSLLGDAWGFRSLMVYAALFLPAFFQFCRQMKRTVLPKAEEPV